MAARLTPSTSETSTVTSIMTVGEPSEVGAVAKTDALLLRMPARRFNELAALYPPALMAISELAQSDDAVYPGTATT